MASRSSTPSNYDGFGGDGGGGGGTSSSSFVGVTRSRTLLFLSFRESAPRPTKRKRRSAELSRASRGDPLGVKPSRSTTTTASGTYFDASGNLQERSTGPLGGDDRYRDDLDGNDDSDRAPLVSRDAHAIDIPTLPPRWVDVSDEVEQILSDLEPKITRLDRLHSKHLLPGFVDRSQEERDIESLTNEITREFRRASKMIASLAQFTQELARSRKASPHEISMAQNVQTGLAQRVQAVSGQFRRKQSNYMQRLKGQDVRHREVMGELGLTARRATNAASSSAAANNAAIRDEELAVREDVELSRQQLQSQQQSQLLFDSEEQDSSNAQINARSSEIQQIAKSIIELSELFQDLNTLVIDQGTLLDRIDYNIETMGQNIQQADRELNTAVRSQKRSGKGMCVLFLVLCCALLIAVILIKPFWRG